MHQSQDKALAAMVKLTGIVEEAIREACAADGYAVSGHLYAALTVHGVTFDAYDAALSVLTRTGRIEMHRDYTITLKEGK